MSITIRDNYQTGLFQDVPVFGTFRMDGTLCLKLLCPNGDREHKAVYLEDRLYRSTMNIPDDQRIKAGDFVPCLTDDTYVDIVKSEITIQILPQQ